MYQSPVSAVFIWLVVFSVYIIPLALIVWFVRRWRRAQEQRAAPAVAATTQPHRHDYMLFGWKTGRIYIHPGQSSILPLTYLPQDYVILEHRQSDSLSFHSMGALFSWRINPGRSMLSLLALDTMDLLRQVTWLEQGKKWSFWSKGIE